MIKHIVLFRFKPEATKTQQENILEAMNELAKAVPEVKNFAAGIKGPFRCTYDIGMVADFDNAEDLNTYLVHPAHRAFVTMLREGDVVDVASIGMIDYEM